MPVRIDSSDPRYLIAYANDEEDHSHAEEFKMYLEAWKKRMEDASDSLFGVIIVNHSHEEHDEDEVHDHAEHKRNEEEENAITALITQFRRENRELTNKTTVGYASVYDGPMTDEQRQAAIDRTNRFSSYMFGVRGRMVKTLNEAKQWIDEVATLEPLVLETAGEEGDSTTTAIFYGSTTGNTELVAEKVQEMWKATHGDTPPIVNVGDTSELIKLFGFNQLLVGVPTWNIGKLQDDWEIVFPMLDRVDLTGKQIAIFGIGDQFGYPENFQDAMGILGRKFQERGAELVGFTSTDGYEHDHSVAIQDGKFMGLAIDDVNQSELTKGRIEAWVAQVKGEFEAD